MESGLGQGGQVPSIDVAVVGGGIIGISASCHLAEEGRSVVLVEQGDLAKGASFGNAGAFAFSDVMPLASPGIMRKAPGWLLDPLGPLSIPPACPGSRPGCCASGARAGRIACGTARWRRPR